MRTIDGVVEMSDIASFLSGYTASIAAKTDAEIKEDLEVIGRTVRARDDFNLCLGYIARTKNRNVIGWFWDPVANVPVAEWIEIEDKSQADAVARGYPSKRTPLNPLENSVFGFRYSRDERDAVVITPNLAGLATTWKMQYDDALAKFVLVSSDVTPGVPFYLDRIYVKLSPGMLVDVESITFDGEDAGSKPVVVQWDRAKIQDLKTRTSIGS